MAEAPTSVDMDGGGEELSMSVKETNALREKLEPICGEISGPFEENLQKFGVTRDRLPYEDESFDLVCALDVLGEAEDDEAVVSELRRVLSPEGLLLLAVPAHPWLYSDNDSGPRRRYTRRSLAKRLRDCDLTPERNTYANSLLFPWTNACRCRSSPTSCATGPSPLSVSSRDTWTCRSARPW